MKYTIETKLKAVIKYIEYYNNERLVWKIQNSPIKYRESLLSDV